MKPPPTPQDEQTLVLGSLAATPAENSRPEFLPVGTRLNEFEICGLIGEGGFGVVYLAYDHLLQRQVALKEYLPAMLALRGQGLSVTLRSQRHADTFAKGLQSFINEARLLAQFDHPALVKVHRFWQDNHTAYLVMPFYKGPTLKSARLAMPQPPAEDWIRRLLAPLLDALELIHGQECLHRDIAPDNILLVDGRPVLLDFGAARRVIGDMTQALTVMLKPGYAPVEQYAEMPGIRQGPWTDLYALGSVVHFLITGEAPPASVSRMMRDPCVALSVSATNRYSASLLDAIDRCLAVRAEDRPQSVGQLRELLEAVASPCIPARVLPVSQLLAGSGPRPGRSRGHRALPALAAAGLLGGWLLYTGEAAAPRNPPTSREPSLSASLPAPPSSPSQQAAASHDLGSAWLAATQAASADFGLSVSGLRSSLQVGRDGLELELGSAREGWVYLLLWDQANRQVGLLLPNQVDRENRIEAGQLLKLPRAGWRYVADAPAGRWQILLLVSESERDFPALGLMPDGVMLAASQQDMELALANSGLSALTGVTRCRREASCAAGYGALPLTLQEVEAR
ncbi:MAG: hypothetical protein RLZZ555_546 [Pseudomonadota bacterium]|jgi:serine/threonine protein kinase